MRMRTEPVGMMCERECAASLRDERSALRRGIGRPEKLWLDFLIR